MALARAVLTSGGGGAKPSSALHRECGGVVVGGARI